jgi:hypothetical protein
METSADVDGRLLRVDFHTGTHTYVTPSSADGCADTGPRMCHPPRSMAGQVHGPVETMADTGEHARGI